MIFVLAAHLEDARQWAKFNGHAPSEWRYVGQSWNFPRLLVSEQDRIVRTARAAEHPAAPELERWLEHLLDAAGLTETVTGRLVRQQSADSQG